MSATARRLPPITLEYVQAERMARSLARFVRGAWPHVEPVATYVHGRHIDVLAEALEAVATGELRRLVVNVPPRPMRVSSRIRNSGRHHLPASASQYSPDGVAVCVAKVNVGPFVASIV